MAGPWARRIFPTICIHMCSVAVVSLPAAGSGSSGQAPGGVCSRVIALAPSVPKAAALLLARPVDLAVPPVEDAEVGIERLVGGQRNQLHLAEPHVLQHRLQRQRIGTPPV